MESVNANTETEARLGSGIQLECSSIHTDTVALGYEREGEIVSEGGGEGGSRRGKGLAGADLPRQDRRRPPSGQGLRAVG